MNMSMRVVEQRLQDSKNNELIEKVSKIILAFDRHIEKEQCEHCKSILREGLQ